jgi:hypothetical protein
LIASLQRYALAASTQTEIKSLFNTLSHCYPLALILLINALMFIDCFQVFAMVRRHGKKIAIAREEKKKKRERGECSTGLDDPGARAPKR